MSNGKYVHSIAKRNAHEVKYGKRTGYVTVHKYKYRFSKDLYIGVHGVSFNELCKPTTIDLPVEEGCTEVGLLGEKLLGRTHTDIKVYEMREKHYSCNKHPGDAHVQVFRTDNYAHGKWARCPVCYMRGKGAAVATEFLCLEVHIHGLIESYGKQGGDKNIQLTNPYSNRELCFPVHEPRDKSERLNRELCFPVHEPRDKSERLNRVGLNGERLRGWNEAGAAVFEVTDKMYECERGHYITVRNNHYGKVIRQCEDCFAAGAGRVSVLTCAELNLDVLAMRGEGCSITGYRRRYK